MTYWAAILRQKADLEAIAKARISFEAAATDHSVDRLNDTNAAFHIAIGRASGNSCIASTNERLRVSRISLSYESSEAAPLESHIMVIIDEHRRFEKLIQEGAAEEELASTHVRLFWNRVFANLSVNLSPAIRIAAPLPAAE